MADDDVVMEEREELMVSATGGDVFLRRAHFLTPSVTYINGRVAASSLSCSATPPAAKYKDLLQVNYHGWKRPQEHWKSWVDRLHPLHHSTWKRAGILDAIMASKCNIHRYGDLVLELVEKWCPKTNSFVFPWGEATITLEDMMVLGSFSVLGASVLIPPENEEMEEIVKKLATARTNVVKMSKAKKADKSSWVAKFMGTGSDIEHEAFLVYWLSRFVFPYTRDTIGTSVYSIAVHLARGTKIALAPSILASIYKSLTFLKAAIVAARKRGRKIGEILEVKVPSPFALVQVWIWERFPSLRPKAESVGKNEPRLARWHDMKLGEYRSRTIDFTNGKDFQWRPYTMTECNAFPGMVYRENERWEMVDSDLDEDLEGFVRCLRKSELVGLEGDCIEHYLPHRVAMQFGMDQDVPGDVARVNANREIAWSHHTRPIRDAKLYVPPRVSEPRVTSRYLAWWRSDVTGPGANGKISYEDSEVEKDLFGRKSEDDFFTPHPSFYLKWKKVQRAGASSIAGQFQDQVVKRQSPLKGSSESSKRRRKFVVSSSGERSDYNNSDPPPGGKGSSKSSKRHRKFVEISSGGKGSSKSIKMPTKFVESSSCGKGSSKSTKWPTKFVESSSGGKGSSKSTKGPTKFVEGSSCGKVSSKSTKRPTKFVESSLGGKGSFKSLKRPRNFVESSLGGKGSFKSLKRPRNFVESSSGKRWDYINSDPPLGGKGSSNGSKRRRKFVVSSSGESSDYNDSDPPPGFVPKHIQEKASHSGSRIEKKVAPLSSNGSHGNNQFQDDAQGKNHSSSTANDGNSVQELEAVGSEVKCMLTEEAQIDRVDEKTGGSPCREQGNTSGSPGIGYEERITTLEKLLALLEAGKLYCLL